MSLYDRLGIPPTATAEEITRAYRRLALAFHPDRNPGGAEQFKRISEAYSVLADAVKRTFYDSTGNIPGADSDEHAQEHRMAERSEEMSTELSAFYRAYTGSEDEDADLLAAFDACRGDFRKIVVEKALFDNGDPNAIRRIQQILQHHIDCGALSATKLWKKTTTSAVVREIEDVMRREREEADEMLRQMKKAASPHGAASQGPEATLAALIKGRQQTAFDDMLANLEAKYAPRKVPGKRLGRGKKS